MSGKVGVLGGDGVTISGSNGVGSSGVEDVGKDDTGSRKHGAQETTGR